MTKKWFLVLVFFAFVLSMAPVRPVEARAESPALNYAANAITRSDIVARAQSWVAKGISYSQSQYASDGYRTDCSGFVSMAWATGTNYNTWTLRSIARQITKDELMAGDILLRYDLHVLIFDKWVDAQKTSYWAYEMTSRDGGKARHWVIPYPFFSWGSPGLYIPYRYNNVIDPPSGYSFCAFESQRCDFTGWKDVAFGAGGKLTYKDRVKSGFVCATAAFGDPAPGVKKACYIKSSAIIPPAGYVYCAGEGQRCKFSGVKDVAYGAYERFNTKLIVLNGIDCNNSIFGDPFSGVGKACFVRASANNPPAGYTLCAREGQRCSFGWKQSVAYGAYGKYVYKSGVGGGIACTNSAFGRDPFVGAGKSCYYK
jgi:hypothetical protein